VVLPVDDAGTCCAPGQVALPGWQGSGEVCCAPLSQGPLSPEQAEQVAPLLKALGDPVRLRLMSLVASRPGGEACVCDLTGDFDLSQPTISHHLKELHEEGSTATSVWVYYKARSLAMVGLGALTGYPGPT
jgi:ArsR family transcriptional regulator